MPQSNTKQSDFSPVDETQRRATVVEFERKKLADGETVSASFSSELPYDRGGYTEILDHGPAAVNFERAQDGLPLLLDHNYSKVIGRVINLRLSGGKLRGTLRFGKSQLAKDVREDVFDGIRREVSVGYSVDDAHQEDDGVIRVTRWTLFEISIVGVPADHTVGIGRAMSQQSRNQVMPDKENHQTSTNSDINVQAERTRTNEILAIGERFGFEKEAHRCISEGGSVDRFRGFVLEQQEAKLNPSRHVGTSSFMDEHFTKAAPQFSLLRAINGLISGRVDGFEREASEELQRLAGKAPNGIFVPTSSVMKRAALTAGGTGTGSELVGTSHLGDEYISPLRSVSKVARLGARVLSGLVGNISLPKQIGTTTAQWVAESTAAAGSVPGFSNIGMAPKQLTANTSYSLKLVKQGIPSIEELLRDDLGQQIGLGVDQAAISGSGTGDEPEGILNVVGINVVAIGTNGGAPAWGHVVKLESAISEDNADSGMLGYLTNSKVRGKFKSTEKATGTAQYIWGNHPQREPGMGMLNGYLAAVSNHVPADLTKGTGTNLSAIIFGNWADLLIGEWGAMDVIVDPYTDSKKGDVNITAHAFVDTAVRHAESFATIEDAETA